MGAPPRLRDNALMTELAALKILNSPIGKIAIGTSGTGLVKLDILTSGQTRAEFSDLPKAHKFALDAADQLASYFSGELREFSVPSDLVGTDFQIAVWREIANLGFGETCTYAEIAAAIGNPKAVRAVGGAVGANPIPLIIGCHRVLGADRKITGYSGGEGIPTKRWLLDFEQISFSL